MCLFTATDPALVEALTSQNLTRILVEARDHRNRWSGHGGVAGTQINLERLKDLHALLERTMSLLAWSFDSWTLLKPGLMILLHGVYEVTASILTGTNPAFGKRGVRLDHPADAAHL